MDQNTPFDCRTVAVGVVNFLIAYIFLLVGFTVSFMILFPRTEAFELMPTAFVKVSGIRSP